MLKLPTVQCALFFTAYFLKPMFKAYPFRPVSILFYEYDKFMECPVKVFDFLFQSLAGLGSLQRLSLRNNELTSLQEGVFMRYFVQKPQRDVQVMSYLSCPFFIKALVFIEALLYYGIHHRF
jgi:hypothetical protein